MGPDLLMSLNFSDTLCIGSYYNPRFVRKLTDTGPSGGERALGFGARAGVFRASGLQSGDRGRG